MALLTHLDSRCLDFKTVTELFFAVLSEGKKEGREEKNERNRERKEKEKKKEAMSLGAHLKFCDT